MKERTRKNSFFTSSCPIRMIKKVDMNEIRRDISEIIFQKQGKTMKSPANIRYSQHISEKEQKELLRVFNQARLKRKITNKFLKIMNTNLHNKDNNMKKMSIDLSNMMVNKRTDVINMATMTLNYLEKTKRFEISNRISELESKPILIPNFLSMILAMKKSPLSMDIKRVA